jgi:hypothetical protein
MKIGTATLGKQEALDPQAIRPPDQRRHAVFSDSPGTEARWN